MLNVRILVLTGVVIFVIAPLQVQALTATKTIQHLPGTTIPEVTSSEPEDPLLIADDFLHELDLLYYQLLFLLSSENGLSPDSDDKRGDNILTRIPVDPVFAVELDILSQGMNRGSYASVQISDASDILILSLKKARFKLTKQSLKNFRDKGIPDEILKELESLEDQEFTQKDDFWDAIEKKTDGERVLIYKDLILEQASGDSSVSTTGLVNVSKGRNFWYITSDLKENADLWDTNLFYSETIRKMPSDKKMEKLKSSSTVNPEGKEKNDGFVLVNILDFFKKWGIPKPLAIVLLFLGIYLILVFLTRK